ncbi:hypothetical protein CsSME_00051472 [Camellia sinensis var. sinensis]
MSPEVQEDQFETLAPFMFILMDQTPNLKCENTWWAASFSCSLLLLGTKKEGRGEGTGKKYQLFVWNLCGRYKLVGDWVGLLKGLAGFAVKRLEFSGKTASLDDGEETRESSVIIVGVTLSSLLSTYPNTNMPPIVDGNKSMEEKILAFAKKIVSSSSTVVSGHPLT